MVECEFKIERNFIKTTKYCMPRAKIPGVSHKRKTKHDRGDVIGNNTYKARGEKEIKKINRVININEEPN